MIAVDVRFLTPSRVYGPILLRYLFRENGSSEAYQTEYERGYC